ncbi:MATE family efflux transporter [Alteromonas mediterranea]|uniref:MATE family efflux transporter n=1 Tax=Alteromonas mediterranea TaxID=314275 RepID=A0AAC9ACS3_9ALTE|nr:MATE efflux family protein [Alteromonas mediterranea DE1]AGP96827.1 MATE efflux family protein [Alteromonas mediterranea UM7]AGQ01169.1 MATE efflux family protein [Alteromonas mediterranea UM4b]AMJ77962.1 MATE family efflux transporter [Alteromonas mediterranea]AMJ82110.1 MATE family efflux transporter [Alteromonas mediterranea]
MIKSNAKQRTSDLLEGEIGATLKRITIPMILGMVMMMSFGLIDTFFVSLLGTDPLAAISFTFPVTFTVISLNIGLGIGTSAIIGKLQGSKALTKSQHYATGSIMLSVLLVGGLALIGFFTIEPVFKMLNATENLMPYIFDYMGLWYLSSIFLAMPMVGNSVLRACGDTRTPSIVMAAGGGLNALLDPIFIFGLGPVPAMGIKGAALATFIAWIVGALWILYILAVRRKLMLPRLLSLSELRESSREILKIGLPAAGANMLTPVAGGIMTAVVASYGAEAVAAWGVGNRMESIASIVVLALSMTLPPFISQNVGAGQVSRVKEAYSLTLKFVLIWQFLIFLVMWGLSSWIAVAFANEVEVSVLIQLFLMIVPLGYGMQGIIILTNSSLNAMHRPMTALTLSVIRLFVFFVPISVAGSFFFELKGLFAGTVIANVAMACVSLFVFKRAIADFENDTSPVSEQ